jgi:hypothetical protein
LNDAPAGVPAAGEVRPAHSIPEDDKSFEGTEGGNRPLSQRGARDAETWHPTETHGASTELAARWKLLSEKLQALCADLSLRQSRGESLPPGAIVFIENTRLIETAAQSALNGARALQVPAVAGQGNEIRPRPYAVASGFLEAVQDSVTEAELEQYLEGIQQVESLMMGEIWALRPMLEGALLEKIAAEAEALTGAESSGSREPIAAPGLRDSASAPRRVATVLKSCQSLRALQEIDWEEFFERTSAAERTLKRDPPGIYSQMDDPTRQTYRSAVEELAHESLFSEEEVARQAVFLAMRAHSRIGKHESRALRRKAHVGYYLLAGGQRVLKRRLGCKPALKQRLLNGLLEWPEIFYVIGVEVTTLLLVFFFLHRLGTVIPLIAGLLLLIPASHAAVGIINRLTGILVPPRRIPKLDFSKGIPVEHSTLVAVPCLLLSEAEVRRNVQSLEIRYLGNRDQHLHYALLTDSPDAPERFNAHDALVDTCSTLINELNEKYGKDGQGSFLHLHRHRVYNPSEGSWMGWERKRGKIMDLNNLLLGGFDSFPVKVGNLSVLPQIRYVITLDADTKLPPGAAHRLVGAMAHPLNQAVVDPKTQTVVEGYGILQPRVSVSIESTNSSRLASIYSGQTGFDIYTQAVSDVYQDLFGEGSFTGKGIYEVETFQRVLGKRFPTNSLLSHDLIEGSYARAGLASDIVVIDDYPSHFSAYSRRLHRWVRGDWQIIQWLFPRVPDYYGRSVQNPLTFISRWKIFDNIRRSVNEVGLFLLLILGWAVLPGGPVFWTLVTLAMLLMPTYSQFVFSLLHIHRGMNWRGFWRERANELVSGHLHVFVMLVFLPHQALVMMDAIVRTLIRMAFTHEKLLQWETAAESELGAKKSLVESYLELTPVLSLAIGLFLALLRPKALLVAAPILGVWLLADFFKDWVNRRPEDATAKMTAAQERFLRLAGLRTWRYFREFANPKTSWLIPDNVQVEPASIAMRLSSTNLGLQFNSIQAAHELGFLTLPEYAESIERTLRSARGLPRFKGHFYNWYDIETRNPMEPRYVSTVDSGNLAASFWTLKQSALGQPRGSLFPPNLWQGIREHIALASEYATASTVAPQVLKDTQELAGFTEPLRSDASAWIGALPWLEQELQRIERGLRSMGPGATAICTPDLNWWVAETDARLRGLRELIENFVPWALPEFSSFFWDVGDLEDLTLASLPSIYGALKARIATAYQNPGVSETERAAARLLERRLPASEANTARLLQAFQRIAGDAHELVQEMDFKFLYNAKKKQFSTGWNVGAGRIDPSHYDLLASEARTAVFIAAAKGDVGPEAWFHLGRPLAASQGERVLLSWSGTMFEYLMPALWMRSLPDTIVDQALRSAVRSQQVYAEKCGIPWGISEAAFSERNSEGLYGYRAFGVPSMALDPHAPENLVVSPYSSFLALLVDGDAPYRNLLELKKLCGMGSMGFYEAFDFTPLQLPEQGSFELIRCWMAHHQGMSLVALCNYLQQSSIQKCFHREPRVMAAELLLHEKAALTLPLKIRPARAVKGKHPAGKLLRSAACSDTLAHA